MPLKTDSNVIITEQLTERLQRIEKQTGGDVLALCVPIRIGVDNFVRDALEALPNKKEKISVVLETGGGYIEVTQRIAHTLRHHYKVVDFVIPNCAYSAGTVLVMSGDAIWMDYYSVLGPIDPQLPKDDKMVPALGYLEQYRRLVEKSLQGKLSTAELAYLIQRFDPAELYKYEQARDLSVSLLREWLVKYKFKNWEKTKTRQKKVTHQMKVKRAEEIAMALNKIDKWNSHGRGIPMTVLQNDLKLEIEDFGKNDDLNAAIRDYYKLLSDYLATVRLNYTIQTRENFWRVG